MTSTDKSAADAAKSLIGQIEHLAAGRPADDLLWRDLLARCDTLKAALASLPPADPGAVASLRHVYKNLMNGGVRDVSSAKRIATGLLAPVIEALERSVSGAPSVSNAPAAEVAQPVVEALRRLERAVDMHLGRSAWTQTTQLKGMAYSESVRKELYAAHDCARTALASSPSSAPAESGWQPIHPATSDLVQRFSTALRDKLAAAEKKYGYSDGWLQPDWMDECRAKLLEHIAKGDPRDVAAYCAFLWHHGESTAESGWNLKSSEVRASETADAEKSLKIAMRALENIGEFMCDSTEDDAWLLKGDALAALEKIKDLASVSSGATKVVLASTQREDGNAHG